MDMFTSIERTIGELGPWGNALVVGPSALNLAERLAHSFGSRVLAISEKAVREAGRDEPTLGAGTLRRPYLVLASVEDLPVRSESQFWVVSLDMPAALGSRATALREMRRVVKPNGHVLLGIRGASPDAKLQDELDDLLGRHGLKREMLRTTDEGAVLIASVLAEETGDPDSLLRQRILERLSRVVDPETGVDVVTMDMILDLKVENGQVRFKFRPTTPYCPITVHLSIMVKRAVQEVDGVKAVDLTVIDYVDAENLTRELRSL